MDALEARLAAIERLFDNKPGQACRFCGGVARLVEVAPNRTFGEMGVKDETWRCDACGKAETIQTAPPRAR